MNSATVVGGGPNGLAAAVALAADGVQVTVFEAADEIGGGARSGQSLVPGLLHDHCSAFHPTAAGSPFLNSLGLDRYGLSWRWAEIDCAHPLDGGDAGLLYRSVEDTAAGLGRDGARWRRAFGRPSAEYDTLASDIMRPLLRPPRHPLALARFGLPAVLPGAAFARLFATEKGRALFGGVAAHAFRPLHYPLTSAIGAGIITAGHRWGWPVAAGGSGSITAALAALLADLGGKIETGVPIRVASQLPPADVTLFDLAPEAIAALLDDQLPARVARAFRRYRRAPGAFKVDFAVEGGVPWANPEVGRAGTVHLGGGYAEIAATEREISAGRMPERPFVLVGQQYLADPQRSAGTVHPVYSYAHVPHGYAGDATGAIIAQIERFAPGFRDRIVAQASHGPASLAAGNPNFAGGDIITGAKDVRQLVLGPRSQLVLRPRIGLSPYYLGIPGMYICSAATPPGPGVHGMCGANAAAEALRYLNRPLPCWGPAASELGIPELPRAHALPPAERLGEARHLDISQPPRHLGDRHLAGDQELFGQLLPDFVQQPAERHAVSGQPAAQRPLAHVQRRRDLLRVRRRGGPGQQVIPDPPGHARPRVTAGQQLPALLAGDRRGVLVGLRQRQIEDLRGNTHRALRRAEDRHHAEDLGVPPHARGRRGERVADLPDVDRRGEQLVLDGLDRRAVPLDHEPPQSKRDVRRVQHQVKLLSAVTRPDPGEREGQVQVLQADIDRAAPGGAADHREPPDAVRSQVIPDPRLQP
jgi:phytoene dehydrogenase-like protein